MAPLIAQRELLGYLYLDIDGAFGRFDESDRDLIAMFASQAAVALDNARSAEGLERKVAERTAEIEQRAAELAVINSIQQGMAAELDFQAIVDLVGDKLREVFQTGDIGIRWYDAKAEPESTSCTSTSTACGSAARPYRRAGDRAKVFAPALETRSRSSRTAAPSRTARGVPDRPGTDQSLSVVMVPIIGGDRVLGHHRHGEPRARERLRRVRRAPAARPSPRAWASRSRTRASSTRRSACSRRASSARPSSRSSTACRQALAVEARHPGASSTLVGDKIREIFTAGRRGHPHLRPASGTWSTIPTYVERGEAHRDRAAAARRQGLHRRTSSRTREPLVVNEDMAQRAAERTAAVIAARHADLEKSCLCVPLLSRRRGARAHQRSQTCEREHAFSESDVRLLQTLANSMSVALENARLFDETQRLFKESEQRAAELAIINSVQQALAAELDMQGIYDAGGRQDPRDLRPGRRGHPHLRPADGPDPLPLRLREGAAHRDRVAPAARDRDSRAHVLRTRETLVINENMAEARRSTAATSLPGHADGEVGGLRPAGRRATRCAG